MKIGLHYHIPFFYDKENNAWMTPGYFGVFVNGLLDQVEQLFIFGYIALPNEIKNCDFMIKSSKIVFINLGLHHSVPKRIFKSYYFIRTLASHIKALDGFIIRTPTPMIIPISFINSTKIQPILVGEYDEAIKSQVGIKGFFLKLLYKCMRYSEKCIVKRNLSFTNSAKILKDYSGIAHKLKLIKTTTISLDDKYLRIDTCQNPVINLLYVGRLDPNKNIEGLIKSVALLNRNNEKKFILNLVYLNDLYGQQYQKELKMFASELNIENEVIFHGQKRVGSELNLMYRQADIFLLVSRSEGFPRVIWESMINNCPVIATKVGSIPHYLVDKKNAVLIDAGVDSQIVDSVMLLVNSAELRKTIINNASELVKDNTIEFQTKYLLSMIQDNNIICKSL